MSARLPPASSRPCCGSRRGARCARRWTCRGLRLRSRAEYSRSSKNTAPRLASPTLTRSSRRALPVEPPSSAAICPSLRLGGLVHAPCRGAACARDRLAPHIIRTCGVAGARGVRERAWIRHPAQSPEPPQLDARGGEVLPLASRGGGAAWSRSSLGTAPARLLCLARARPTAWGRLGHSVLPGSGRPTGRPATASRARARRHQGRRFHRHFFLSAFSFFVTMQVARRKTEHDAHWTLNLPSNVRLQGVPEKKLRALDAWEVNDADEGKDAPRQVEP